jgi:hypothetical protein
LVMLRNPWSLLGPRARTVREEVTGSRARRGHELHRHPDSRQVKNSDGVQGQPCFPPEWHKETRRGETRVRGKEVLRLKGEKLEGPTHLSGDVDMGN